MSPFDKTLYGWNDEDEIMDNKTCCVDYSRDIAELAMEVLEQSKEIDILCKEIAALRRQLEAQGTLYGGAVAYAVAVGQPQPIKYYNSKGEAI